MTAHRRPYSATTMLTQRTEIASSAFCLAAVEYALTLANPRRGSWRTTNRMQERFFELYGGSGAGVEALSAYLQGLVTSSAAELNAWFERRGWPGMNLDFGPDGLGVGSIFDLLVDWAIPGKKKALGIRDARSAEVVVYEGAEISASDDVRAHTVDGCVHPMFELRTRQDGWIVFLVEAGGSGPDDPMELPRIAADLLGRRRSGYSFATLEFPAVTMATGVDISWMRRMSVDQFRIDEAIKRVRLRLDDKGAHAESAVALVTRSPRHGIYRIERPFYVIFWREGLAFPPFVALAAADSWVRSER